MYDPQAIQSSSPHQHPYLRDPLLYISNLPSYVTEENIAMAFVHCGPFRPKILRDGTSTFISGSIEFKFLDKAEKALATLQSRVIPNLAPPASLVLSPYPPTIPPSTIPPPNAVPRLVKHLPQGYTDSQLYDLFRPFGALASVRAQTHFGPDTGMIEFWYDEDARCAEEAMHYAEVEGQHIAVQIYQPRRTASGSFPEFSPTAPAFIPAASVYSPYPTQYSPPRTAPYPMRSPQSPQFIHGPGQQVQLAPLTGLGSTSHSGLIDPCNLFCKNLDPEIDSNALFSHFRQFGQIVSARVMRNETGESRGFGFVSFQTPEQASSAMHAMNGVQLGSKQIVVRLHEPKQLRQEKLAQRFAHNGHPRSASGATSPTASEIGDFAGWQSPRGHHTPLAADRQERGRRGSGSYYNAALSGTLNLPMRYDDLAALSPVVRREVLTGELSRRVKTMDVVPADDIDDIVRSLVTVSLSEVIKYIEDPNKLKEQVLTIEKSRKSSPEKASEKVSKKSPSPAASASASNDSSSLDPNVHNATASAPEHPSTPVSISATSTPPRTSSPSGSVPPVSERDRMLASVSKLESSRLTELTDLLMTLPKRERALCLFNVEVLRAKLADAKMVLDSEDEPEGKQAKASPSPATPVTPQSKKPLTHAVETPKTPELSSAGPSATSSPFPATPGTAKAGATTHTMSSLSRLPAAEVIRLANLSSTEFPLPKPDDLVVQTTDEFIDGLLDKPLQVQKQQLGDKLFRVVKSFGVKSAPKITIALLDQEDLRALAHLMNSYPEILKSKAIAMVGNK